MNNWMLAVGLGLCLNATAFGQTVPVGTTNPYPTKATLLWQTNLDASTTLPPVTITTPVGPDGTVYAFQFQGGEISALNPDMSLKWGEAMELELVSSVAVATDGSLIVPGAINGAGDSLYSLNPTNGAVNWAINFSDSFNTTFFSPPAIGPDGTIYIIYGNYAPAGYYPALLAITNGVIAWTNVITTSTYDQENAPSIGPDGTIYFIDSENNVNAVNPDGSARWTDPQEYVSGASDTSPVIGLDGTVYVTTDVGQFVALEPDGVITWCYSLSDTNDFSFVGAPEIGPDGTIYCEVDALATGDTNYIYALNPDGTLKWTFPIAPTPLEDASYAKASACAIASEGEIFVTDTGGNVYSLAPNGTQNWAYQTASTGLLPPMIGPEGHVYVASYDDNNLYCFAGSPVACGVWPQFRRNARQTGAVATAGVSGPVSQTNGFQVTLSGAPHMPVCAYASSDLASWTNLGQVLLPATGTTNYLDKGAGRDPHRFYRAFPQ